MRTRDFHYDLPDDLIAQQPLPERSASRLLVLDGASGHVEDRQFRDLPGCLRAGDLLVFNDTRVIPARLHGHKDSGGKVEILVERITGSRTALAHVRASKSPKPGTRLHLEGGIAAIVQDRKDDLFALDFDIPEPLIDLLERHGHMPLPPYIERADDSTDRERYQTVYACRPGAVAAPTAGLHFDQAMLERLADMGIDSVNVTLHVGAGTFQPVRVENINEHRMHSEYIEINDETCRRIEETRARGGRIVAVGTTSVRCLETAAASGTCRPYQGETDIFIHPGYRFRIVDAMLTNFHLPESTLLMLVCAFAGYGHTMRAYRHAVEERYRFFSYGDAMFVTRNPTCDSNT